MNRPLRIGFAGAGQFARKHMASLAQMEGVEIACIWNRIEQKEMATEASAIYGGAVYTDLEKMIKKERLDAVYICLIPSEHGRPENLCLQKNLAMFIEKPLSTNYEIADNINQKIKEEGLVTASGYQWRYLDLVERMKAKTTKERPFLAQAFWMSKFPTAAWWSHRKLSGGQVVEQTTHMFDLARYLFGEAEEIQAFWSPSDGTLGRGDVEKVSTVNIRFSSGTIMNIVSSCYLPVRYRAGFTLFTENTIMELISRASGTENTVLKIINKEGEREIPAGNNPLIEEDKTFIEAVKKHDPSLIKSDYHDALKTLKLTLSVYESIEKRTIIQFPKEA